jgi:transposase
MGQTTRWTVGLDLGDRFSRFCALDTTSGEIVEEGSVKTERCALEEWLATQGSRGALTVVMEAGTHSPWVSRLVESQGHEAVVANPRELAFIFRGPKKTDRVDAMKLAEVTGYRRQMVHPLRHRSESAQAELAVLKARDALVRCRTRLINSVRGQVKSAGARIKSGVSAEAFPREAASALPQPTRLALEPLLETIVELTRRIRAYDRTVHELCSKHPETERLRQVAGVGEVISLAYVLIMEDPKRFADSRKVGAWLGLTPRLDLSGDEKPELPITKAGNPFLRKLLLQGAHYILGENRPDSDLRRWGRARLSGGKNAKKRTVVAVARKLAVLLHVLWVREATYEPLRGAKTPSPTMA